MAPDEQSVDRRQIEQRQDDRLREAAIRETALSDHDLLIELRADVRHLASTLDIFMAQVDLTYVKREEFKPVRNVVYGIVTLILSGVIGGLLALVLKGK
jgi:hypothetical protein